MEGTSAALVIHCPMSQAVRGQSFLTVRAAPVQEVDFQHPISHFGPVWLLQKCFSQSSTDQWTVFLRILLFLWAPEKNGILFIPWVPEAGWSSIHTAMDLGRKKDFLISFWSFFFPKQLSLSSPWPCLRFGIFLRYFPKWFWSTSGFANRPFSILTFFYPFHYSATEEKTRKILKYVQKREYDLKHKLFWKLFLLWLA